MSGFKVLFSGLVTVKRAHFHMLLTHILHNEDVSEIAD